jgi:Sec-independent protein translocase protein TatA
MEKLSLIFVMVLVVFGAKRIREIGASIGKGIASSSVASAISPQNPTTLTSRRIASHRQQHRTRQPKEVRNQSDFSNSSRRH